MVDASACFEKCMEVFEDEGVEEMYERVLELLPENLNGGVLRGFS